MYDLYTKVIRAKKRKSPDFQEIERLRKQRLARRDTIEILDLGAGSRLDKSNVRTVGSIARNAEKPARFGRFFYRLTQHLNPKNVIELGTSLGLTTAYFAKAAPQAEIFSLEGCPETLHLAEENFSQLGIDNVQTVLGNIDQTFPEFLREKNQKVDLVFFDANHREEPTVRYFHDALPYRHDNTVFVFDDIYWSEGMTAAWETIKAHPDVTVTVDLFWIGLVFFRKEQAKENFVLRF